MGRNLRVAVPRWEDIPVERLHNYWDRLREADLEAVDVSGRGASLEGCAGLLLTGGIDIDPALYGVQRHPEVEEVNRLRDEFELALLSRALEWDLPVLAICRGHQLLNVCLGGSLLQHIEGNSHRQTQDGSTASAWHEVTIESGSKLGDIYGGGRILVNSRHHQAVTVEGMAPGLGASASSTDGLVEGIESPAHRWAVGIQWHPERPEPEVPGFAPGSRRLFEAFARSISSMPAR